MSLEDRVHAIEQKQIAYDELVELAKEVRVALRWFVRFGNAVKWVAGLFITLYGFWVAAKKWLIE